MTIDNTDVARASEASEALRALGDHGPTPAPGVDRFTWSADVLDELARVADLLAEAVHAAAGERSPQVERHAEALVTAIVAHRNSLLRHGRGADGPAREDAGPGAPDPFATRGDRTTGPATATGSRGPAPRLSA